MLSEYTSWRVGGPAKHLLIPHDIHELSEFLKNIAPPEPILWLGLGSNVLIRDGGFNGTVVITQGSFLNKLDFLEHTPNNFKPKKLIRLEAGVPCGTAARFCARNGLSGLEFLAGVPGTIGGALCLNAGAHGSETWDSVTACEIIDKEGQLKIRPHDDYDIYYRHINLKNTHSGNNNPEWFIAGYFSLTPCEPKDSLLKIKTYLAHRALTQPINLPSCGSVFRNPPHQHAAKLIESAGLKGFKIGGAEISTKHANFIVNTHQATANDIELLIKHIIKTVQEQSGITLIPEVHIVGES